MTDLLALESLLAVFANRVNRQQANANAFLDEENRVLQEQLGCAQPDGIRRRLPARPAVPDLGSRRQVRRAM